MIKPKSLLHLLTITGLIFLATHTISAVIPSSEVTPATDDTVVSVTVVEQTLGPVLIVSPSDYQSLSTLQPNLVWQRPDPYPPTPVDTYDVYLDGELLAVDIPEDLTYDDTNYFYDLYRELDVFTLDFKTDLSQGYHTWQVYDYNWIPLTNSSPLMHFYIDTINPDFTLVDVDTNTLNWDTSNEYTIPAVENRYLTTTSTPVFSGTAEDGSNLQIVIKCPTGLSGCTDITEVINIQSGIFEYTAPELQPNQTYSIYMDSRDSADNTASLPVFYINYPYTEPTTTTTATPTPTTTTTPTATPTTTITPTPTPTNGVTITPTPTATVSATPTPEYPTPTLPPELGEPGVPEEGYQPPTVPKPTAPPAVTPKVREPLNKMSFLPLVIFLLVIGLPLHLAATQFGRDISIKQTFLFLYSLLFPFISKKKYQTTIFSYLSVYDPQTNKMVYQTISDIYGLYYLKPILPEKIYIKIHSYNRYFEPTIKNIKELSNNCLLPRLKRYQTRLERLQRYSYEYRIAPLILGLLTAIIAMFVYQKYLLLIYLYLCLQAIYSEYIYQK